jgi:hypothetical protein
MKNRNVLLALGFSFMVLFQASPAAALSCMPVDMYLESAVADDMTQIFIGKATAVKNHTQVVTVSDALQGYVAPQVWVEHNYSTDWQYFCSNGPAAEGKETIFVTTFDQYGTRMVAQTIAPESESGKKLLDLIEEKTVEAGITEATAEERATEVRQTIMDLVKVLMNKLAELKYWQSK